MIDDEISDEMEEYDMLSCVCRYHICDWLWENPPFTHKDYYLETRN